MSGHTEMLRESRGAGHTQVLGPLGHGAIIQELPPACSLAAASDISAEVSSCIVRVGVLKQPQHPPHFAEVPLLRSLDGLLRYPVAQHVPAWTALAASLAHACMWLSVCIDHLLRRHHPSNNKG